MCGIFGIISKQNVKDLLLNGLKRLEYRGYDSAGIAVSYNNQIECIKSIGKVEELEKKLKEYNITAHTGIGHIRWATHGKPTHSNAHPHLSDDIALVHNGIIENYKDLKDKLKRENVEFTSETDSEVIPKLISFHLKSGKSLKDALGKTLKMLHGAYAFTAILKGKEGLLFGAAKGAPLAIGYGEIGEKFVGSDAYALAPLTSKISYLKDGDWFIIENDQVTIFDKDNNIVTREIKNITLSSGTIGKDGYSHYMLKEIYEQPIVLANCFNNLYDQVTETIELPISENELSNIKNILIIACGTSYYAGMAAKYWFENIASIPTQVEVASEFRYRNGIIPDGSFTVFISQSGETADTIASLKLMKDKGHKIHSIVNVEESTMANLSDVVFSTMAGPEIGVASTKAYTTQLMTLACLTIKVAKAKKTIDSSQMSELLGSLIKVPGYIAEILEKAEDIKLLAKKVSDSNTMLFTGRGISFAVSLEGALKLKEISYIHAEAIAAGELKHGTIALIDENMKVIVIVPNDNLFEKTMSNIEQIVARGGKIIALTNSTPDEKLKSLSDNIITLPEVTEITMPIIYIIPLQLLAYYVALHKGTDIDQPRNLAKSVTVE